MSEYRKKIIQDKLMQTSRLKVIMESGKVLVFRCYTEHIYLLKEALDNVLTVVFSDELYADEEKVKDVKEDERD